MRELNGSIDRTRIREQARIIVEGRSEPLAVDRAGVLIRDMLSELFSERESWSDPTSSTAIVLKLVLSDPSTLSRAHHFLPP
jgi:hypothetical protein